MTAVSNRAAYLPSAKALFEIKTTPTTQPEDHQILIRTHAIAINPIDAKIKKFAFFPLNYPVILGQDVAGEVVEVGPEVTRFNVGDKVFGLAAGTYAEPSQKAFQEYVILTEDLAAHVPTNLGWEIAVVLPLGLATASAGLFLDRHLGLKLPTEARQSQNENEDKEVVIVWGGAGSVGSNAIQLAAAAGYEVFTTCSAKNFEFVKSLGASEAFDYRSSTVAQDMIVALKGSTVAGVFDAIGGPEIWTSCLEVLHPVEGKKNVATVLPSHSFVPLGGFGDVKIEQVQALSIKGTGAGKRIWEFVERALEAGIYKAAPEPLIVGKGLKSVELAVEVMANGVSAKKVVVIV